MALAEHIKHYNAQVQSLLTNPQYGLHIACLLLLFESALCSAIIQKIPYTEIDWRAYMQQIAIYRSGERNYTKIYGDTGPLVYGAGHVYVYDLLYKVTDEGKDIRKAQWIFAGVYLFALGTVMACYRKAKAPPYIFVLLVLSKRLHSIFLLRLFNDCFAVLALFLAVYAYQIRFYTIGSLLFSYGLATKLPLILAGPAILFVLFQGLDSRRAFTNLNLMLQLQIVLGWPFWSHDGKAYFGRAFQLGRQFLFKWTVNWRFVGKEVFLSREFAVGLLVVNAAVLLLFATTRWSRPSGLSLMAFIKTLLKPLPADLQLRAARNVTPDFVLTSILSCLVIGLLCARSLHYQFYAYIAWSTPFLLWRANAPIPLTLAVWSLQEYAWNVYPSTTISSIVVIGCLGTQVAGVWWGTREEGEQTQRSRVSEKAHEHHE